MLILLLATALLLCSCSGGDDTDKTSDEIQKDEQEVLSENTDTPAIENENEIGASDENSEGNALENDSSAEQEVIENVPAPDSILDPTANNRFVGETLDQFFENAAFVGDSVMHGMELYSKYYKTIESNATFLTVTSFSARHGLSDLTEKSYHPTYNGEKMKVEDALALDGANKVFIFLGLNDVLSAPTSYYDNYIEFVESIKEKNPTIDIFIVSTTYPVAAPHSMDTATATSYRDKLLDLNTKLKEYCDTTNAYYIDVVSSVSNTNGFLADEYSSDNYVHLTNKAYGIWAEVIESYASALLSGGSISDVVSYPPVPVELPAAEQITEEAAPEEQQSVESVDVSFETAATETPETEIAPEISSNTEETAQPGAAAEQPASDTVNTENTEYENNATTDNIMEV